MLRQSLPPALILVAEIFNEHRELRVGDGRCVHEESIDRDAMDGPRVTGAVHADLVQAWRVGSTHRELAARDPHHALRRGVRRGRRIRHRRLERIAPVPSRDISGRSTVVAGAGDEQPGAGEQDGCRDRQN